MTWAPFPIAGGCYKDDTLPWSAQDTVNWIPVVAEVQGTRTPVMLRGAPGLVGNTAPGTVFSTFDSTLKRRAGVVVRGTYNADGVFVVVQGNTLYRYINDSTEPTAIGAVPGVERVSITHNQRTGGGQIVVANGTAGYVYDTAAGTFTQITDDGFPGAKSVDYIDSYIVGVEPGGRFWFNSALADATSYNTLDRYEAEAAPDKIVGLIVSHSEVIVFGERTMEFFYDSGANTTTFQRRNGTQTEVGAASQFAIVKLDNTVYWLGNDGLIYRLDGYTPVRISLQPIEQQIARSDLSKCFAMVYEDRGHKIVYFTFPDGLTWGYDVATQEWHRRKSYGINRWRVNTLTKWAGKWYAGDYTNGSLCTVEWGINTENGMPLVSERTAPVMHKSMNRFRLNAVRLSIDSQKSANGPPFALSGDLPDSRLGLVVSYPYKYVGGVGLPAFTIASGALPAGLTMDSHGVISGTVAAEGFFSWTVVATDAIGTNALLRDSCNVGATYGWTWAKGPSNTANIGVIMVPKADQIAGVVWGGAYSGIFTTSDGKTWTKDPDAITTYQVRRIDVTDTAIFACVADAGNSGHLYRKKRTGGTGWTEVKNGTTALPGTQFICSSNAILYTTDGVALVSTDDGSTWQNVTVPASFNPGDSILFFDGIYIPAWEQWIIPGQGVLYTANGSAPTQIDIAIASTLSIGTCAYSNALDTCVVAGYQNVYVKVGKSGAWQTSQVTTGTYLYGVVWVDSLALFVALSGPSNTNGLWTSPDGIHWSAQPDSSRDTTEWLVYMSWLGEMCSGVGTVASTNATYVSTI